MFKAKFLRQAMPLTERGKSMLDMTGNRVIEEVAIGDYELYLVHDTNFSFYQLGMQRKGQDMTDLGQQSESVSQAPGAFSRKLFKDTITRWLQKYHTLIIASHNPEKTQKYVNMLKAVGFKPQSNGMFAFITDGRK